MQNYILKTEPDSGTEYIQTCSKDAKTAIENFTKAYNAPMSAVSAVYEFSSVWFGNNPQWLIEKKLAVEIHLEFCITLEYRNTLNKFATFDHTISYNQFNAGLYIGAFIEMGKYGTPKPSEYFNSTIWNAEFYPKTDNTQFKILKIEMIENLSENIPNVIQTTFKQFLRTINFKNLKRQKLYLLDAINHYPELEGILNLIDTIQDIATDEYGYNEKDVFNQENENVNSDLKSIPQYDIDFKILSDMYDALIMRNVTSENHSTRGIQLAIFVKSLESQIFLFPETKTIILNHKDV